MKAPVTLSVWTEGDSHVMDRSEVRRALRLLIAPGERHEIRCLPGGRCKIVSGDDLDAATDAACSLDGTIYYSLNPISNVAERANKSTVVRRTWMLVDVDPVKAADASATEAEKAKAAEVVSAINDHLLSIGWPAPLIIDSGNGWHLVYRVDLPNDKLSHQIIKQCIYALADRFDTEHAKVDRAVHDPARISKVPGTWSRKGVDTVDRPHRMARVAFEPESLDVVPVAAIKAAGAKPEAAESKSGKIKAPVTGSTPTLTNYVKTAVDRECVAVTLAPAGERNNRLNIAAFNLGTLGEWPEMIEAETKATLRRAAIQAGLGETETRLTIESGWTAGAKSPRVRPEPEKAVSGNGKTTSNQPIVMFGSNANPEVVEWIWQDRIAIKFINLFAGRSGVGKSFVLLDVAARLSQGLPMPNETTPAKRCNSLFISEDPYRYVLIPRLIELKADLSRIAFLEWSAMAEYQLSDTDMLTEAWEQSGRPRLIVVDPPTNFMGGRDDHKNTETRSMLMKFVEWMETRDVAICLITHFNKGGAGKGLDAVDRIMASVAWVSTSRVACGFEVDADNPLQCVFGGIKNNLGPKAGALAYRIEKTDALAKVVWLGAIDTTIDDAVSKTKRTPRRITAEDFLVRQFRMRRNWCSDDLYDIGKSEGVSRNAIYEAKGTLPIRAVQIFPQDGGRKYWEWQASPEWPPLEEAENSNRDSGIVGLCERNTNGDNTHRTVPISEPPWDSTCRIPESQNPRIPAVRRVGTEGGAASLRPLVPWVDGARQGGRRGG